MAMDQLHKYLSASLVLACFHLSALNNNLLTGQTSTLTRPQPFRASPPLFESLLFSKDLGIEFFTLKARIGENLDSSKQWLVENSHYGAHFSDGSTSTIPVAGNVHLAMTPPLSQNQEIAEFCVPNDYQEKPGVIQYGRPTTQSGSKKSGSCPQKNMKASHVTRHSEEPSWKKKKGKKRTSEENKELKYIRSMVYEPSEPMTTSVAKVLYRYFRLLPHGHTEEERMKLIRLNDILSLAAYGPEGARVPEQLLRYVEHQEDVATPFDALEVLNQHFGKWRHTTRHKHGKSNSYRQLFLMNRTLLWAVRINLRLQRHCCAATLDKEWAFVKRQVDSRKLDLDGVLDLLTKLQPQFDPELYLLTLMQHQTPLGSRPDYLEETWQVFDAQIFERWLGEAELPKFKLFTLLKYEIFWFDQSNDSKSKIQHRLKLARGLAKPNSGEMDFVYRCEHQLYLRLGYQESKDPLNLRTRGFDQMFKQHQYERVIGDVMEFLEERNYLITRALRKKLDALILRSHAAEFAAHKSKIHRKEAVKMLPAFEEIPPEGFPMMVVVYRDLDMLDLARETAIRLFNLTLYDAHSSNVEHFISALETLAESTIPDNLDNAIDLYCLLLGPQLLNEIFPDFRPASRCIRLQYDAYRKFQFTGVSKPARISANIIHMYRNLRRYGHFREAITVAYYLMISSIRDYVDTSDFFNQMDGSSNFYSALHQHLILMHYALDQTDDMKNHISETRASGLTDVDTLKVLKLLSSLEGDLTEIEYLDSHSRYQTIVFSYWKLIYLTRQIQLNPENTAGNELELVFLFFDLWESTISLLNREPGYRNGLFMIEKLKAFYKRFSRTIDSISHTSTVDNVLQQKYPLPPKGFKPEFFSDNFDFHYLEEKVLSNSLRDSEQPET